MNIQAKLYDRILILHFEGVTTAEDVQTVESTVAPHAGKITSVIALLDKAEFKDEVLKTFQLWREQAKLIKIKIYLVRKNSKFTDIPGLVEALDLINTTESSKLVELFSKETQFETLKTKLADADAAVTKVLNDVPEIPKEDLSTVLPTLQELCSKLEQEYKNISSEISALNRQPRTPPNEENAARVKAAKKEVISTLKSLGLLT